MRLLQDRRSSAPTSSAGTRQPAMGIPRRLITACAVRVESNDPNAQMQAIQGIEDIMVSQLPVIPLTVNVYWDEYTTTQLSWLADGEQSL